MKLRDILEHLPNPSGEVIFIPSNSEATHKIKLIIQLSSENLNEMIIDKTEYISEVISTFNYYILYITKEQVKLFLIDFEGQIKLVCENLTKEDALNLSQSGYSFQSVHKDTIEIETTKILNTETVSTETVSIETVSTDFVSKEEVIRYFDVPIENSNAKDAASTTQQSQLEEFLTSKVNVFKQGEFHDDPASSNTTFLTYLKDFFITQINTCKPKVSVVPHEDSACIIRDAKASLRATFSTTTSTSSVAELKITAKQEHEWYHLGRDEHGGVYLTGLQSSTGSVNTQIPFVITQDKKLDKEVAAEEVPETRQESPEKGKPSSPRPSM